MEKTTEKKPKAAAHKAPVHRAATAAHDKKPRAPRKKEVAAEDTEVASVVVETPLKDGRYMFATGRRKTAVATVRVFAGKGDILVNKKPFTQYFSNKLLQDIATRPFHATGMGGSYYFVATINGGGINAQAEALAHGISKALVTLGLEVRKVLKKNGLLTRDDRKKERKKPGLRRARRAPQWAKR
jgi:small subunit ribosomal protein S9